jgi:hypothetical protein
MKKCFLIFFVLFIAFAKAQSIQFAAAKEGLSMRKLANASSSVIVKIAYGQKLQLITDTAMLVSISTGGFSGYWQKVKYNNQVGYVVSSYLFPVAPPKASTKSLKDYLAQLSPVASPMVVVKKGTRETAGDMYTELNKQLYKNCAAYHEMNWYESLSKTYFIPDFSIEQAFLLVRLIGETNLEVAGIDEFPTKNSTIKLKDGDKHITVLKSKWSDGTEGPINRIIIETEEGGNGGLEIFLLDGDVVISYSWGA